MDVNALACLTWLIALSSSASAPVSAPAVVPDAKEIPSAAEEPAHGEGFASGFLDAASSEPSTDHQAEETAASALVPEAVDPHEPPSRQAWYRDMNVHGFVEAGFIAQLPSGTNGFFVGEAEIDIERRFFDVARLQLDLNLIQRRPWEPALLLGLGGFGTPAATADSLIEQAFVEFFPLGDRGPKVRLGKYNALIAHERLDPTDRPLVSQSLVFVHGSPANFTGLAIDLPELWGFTFTAHAAFNGWDRGVAVTKGKSFGGKLAYHHVLSGTWAIDASAAALYGTERFANERDARITGFASVELSDHKQFSLAAEAMYGREGPLRIAAMATLPPATRAEFYGVSGFLHWTFLTWLSASLRYDYFADPDNTRGLGQTFVDVAQGGATNRQQFTLGARLQPFEGASIRAEYTADFLGRVAAMPRKLDHRLGLTAVLAF